MNLVYAQGEVFMLLAFLSFVHAGEGDVPTARALPPGHFCETWQVTVPHPEVAIVMAKQHLKPHTTLTLERSFLQSVVVSAQQRPF